MKFIQKKPQPEPFKRYKRKKGSSFKELSNNFKVKTYIRKSLLEEQGYICCYCGQEIKLDSSVVEHIKSRDIYPNLQLEYNNMVCSCNGGKDKRANNPQCPLYCDANKKSREIYVNPLEEECERKFEFDEDGNIYGLDIGADTTIEVLNLNNPKLKNLRKSAIAYYTCQNDDDIDWAEELEKIKKRDTNGKFLPFCFVIRNYIEIFRLPYDLSIE